LPTTNAYQSAYAGRGAAALGDGFIAKFDPTGTNLLYCTYLGGSGDDQINGLTVRPIDGEIGVTGFTDSGNFPLQDAVQSTGYQGLFKSADGANTFALSNNGLASSVIYALQIDPANPGTVYALTAAGGFKSTDGGAHWASATSGLGFLSPSANESGANTLALDPAHPGTLYAACVLGVYKTVDGGASWASFSTGIAGGAFIQCVAIDPTTPATVYAGTYFNGIYKSTDGGNSWNAATNGLTILNIQTIVVDPNNPSNVYAGAEFFGSGSGIFKSTNGGGSWTRLSGGGLIAGPVAQLAANGAGIYALIGDDSNNPVLQVTTNGGVNWFLVFAGQGFKFTALAFAAASSPALTIANSGGNEIISWPVAFAGYVLQSTSLLRPANWQNVTQSRVTNNSSLVVTIPQSGGQAYYRLLSTNGATAAVPTIYLGTDSPGGYGVLKSADGGQNWTGEGPYGDTVNAIAVDPVNAANLYAGLNGGRDAFVAAFTPEGQLDTSTFLGGSGLDQGNAIANNTLNDLFVVGTTSSLDFPATSGTGFRPADFAPSDSTRPSRPKEKGTATAFQFNLASTSKIDFASKCPSNQTVFVLGKVNNGINYSYPIGTQSKITLVSSTLPLDISGSHDDGNINFVGNPAQAGFYTYEVRLQYMETYGNCDYTYTFNLIIAP
jgi:hypothetical protein